MKNADSQIIRYAKNWFKQEDLFKDMQILVGDYCGCGPEYISRYDIFLVLFKIVYPYIKEQSQLREFLEYVVTEQHIHYKDWNVWERFVRISLSFLSMIRVVDGLGNILLELDEPNYNLLPKKRGKNEK